jgi:hypothetical protein
MKSHNRDKPALSQTDYEIKTNKPLFSNKKQQIANPKHIPPIKNERISNPNHNPPVKTSAPPDLDIPHHEKPSFIRTIPNATNFPPLPFPTQARLSKNFLYCGEDDIALSCVGTKYILRL